MNRLIGVVHLAALPGSPGFTGDFEAGLAAGTNPVDPARAAPFVRAAR